MDRKLFGTDGIRGLANKPPMTAETSLKLGRAAAYAFKKDQRPHRFVIGKDTRLSGYLFETSLASGICSMGDEVMLVGPLPTPAIAFITRSLRADAGIVISASHNPYQDNGIKFFSDTGSKLPDSLEKRIEDIYFSGEADDVRPIAGEIGKMFRVDDAAGRYVEFVKNTIPRGMDFSGFKVVLDCAHGAVYKVAPAVFREMGAEITVIGDKPDGLNINENFGSLYPEKTARLVKEYKADIGFAFDGDGDRVIAVAENGEILDGDHILSICGAFLKEKNQLNNNTVVSTVMANMGLDHVLKKSGIEVIKTRVGDRYVMEGMNEVQSVLGGEQSGHIIFSDYNTTGDGLITAVQLLRIVKETGRQLSDLASGLVKFPQYIQNIRVNKKIPLEKLPDVLQAREKIEETLGSEGRVLLRYSGTESLIRIMIESIKELNINELTQDLINSLKKNLS